MVLFDSVSMNTHNICLCLEISLAINSFCMLGIFFFHVLLPSAEFFSKLTF